jgi:hypothetical protein
MTELSVIDQLKNLILNVQEARQSIEYEKMPIGLTQISNIVESLKSVLPAKYTDNIKLMDYLASQTYQYLFTGNLYKNVQARIYFDALEYNANFIIQDLSL